MNVLCAEAESGTSAASASAAQWMAVFIGVLRLRELSVRWCKSCETRTRAPWMASPGKSGTDLSRTASFRIEVEAQRAEFALALRVEVLRRLRRPVERDRQHFAAAELARGSDDELVTSRGEIAERRPAALEVQPVLTGRTRRAADAVDRQGLLAAAAAPPLAQVGEPLGARFHLARLRILGRLLLVPHREVRGDAAILAFDPRGDIWAVVLRDVHARDRHGDVERSRRRGGSDGAEQGGGSGSDTHALPRQWINNSAISSGSSTPRPTIGQVEGRCRACICSRNGPLSENTSAATANRSMNQLH